MSATEPYWRSWYENMSKNFLSIKAAKLLIIAGPDRLDTPLTIAQMQGKYQIKFCPHSGHFVHEDV